MRNAAVAFYWYNLPIAVPFVAFLVERRRESGARRVVDSAVLLLALMRVFLPPWPFASGHVLFTAHAAATARTGFLRWTAGLVLLQVAFTKLFLTGGWQSLLLGLAAAAVSSRLWRLSW